MFKRNKKIGTDGKLIGALSWVLAALIVGLVPHTFSFPLWISTLTIGCAIWRWWIEHRRWHLPPIVLRLPLALAAFLGVLATYGTINGIGPGTALLTVMAALKLLETRRRRDLYVTLFICLFLVLSTLLREQTLWSLPYLAGALFVITAAWINVARQGAVLPIKTSGRLTMRLLAHALPLIVVFWVLFPRVPGPFWAVPREITANATTGISNKMSPGDISKLSQSDAVAFRVRFDSEVPTPRALYWRGPVMYRFNGRTWLGAEAVRFTTGGAHNIEQAGGEATRYTLTLEATGQRWLFGLDIPRRWTADRAFMATHQELVRSRPIDETVSYSAVSFTDYRLRPPLTSRGRQQLVDFSDGSNPRTVALAREMRNNAGNDSDYISDVLRMFREQSFFYTLEPPPLGNDPVDEFLFSTRRGFCEHYASAFAVMARAAGIPTRIVAGYHGGEMNRFGNYMIVRQSDAHAWTEVWSESDGWLRVDPTAAVSPSRVESGLSAALLAAGERRGGFLINSEVFRDLGLTWDAINARWDEWILGYGPETQANFMRWLGMKDPRWETLITWLTFATVAVLAILTLVLARRFRRPLPDASVGHYLRLVKSLNFTPQDTESPSDFCKKAVQKYPQLQTEIQAAVADYQALRYAGLGSLEALRAAVDALSVRVPPEPETAAARH